VSSHIHIIVEVVLNTPPQFNLVCVSQPSTGIYVNKVVISFSISDIENSLVFAIGMFNAMIVSFLERIYEVGIMKSLGATDRDIKKLFLIKLFIMGFLGGSTGVAIGAGFGMLANFGLSLFASHFGRKAFTLFITLLWCVGLAVASVFTYWNNFWILASS